MKKHIGDHIKLILFDHDDTLVSTIPAKWQQHKFIAKKYYDIILTDDVIRTHWGKPFDALVKELYQTDDTDQAIARNVKWRHLYPKVLFDYTVPALKKLIENGKQLGIITATNRQNLAFDLSSLNIPADLFTYTQTFDETDHHKPSPKVFDPMLTWAAKNNIKRNEIIYIGDGMVDMQAAVSAGLEFIGVHTGLYTSADFMRHGASSINNISDL